MTVTKKFKTSEENMTDLVSRIKLHPEGPEFSRLVYGTWRLADGEDIYKSPRHVLERIKTCLDLGITTFDLADIYGAYTYEKLFGQALALEPSLREKMELVTKCGILIECEQKPGVYVKHYDTSKDYILASVDRSLEQVGTTYFDLLLVHRPDPLMKADEVAEAFKILKDSGKVKYFGVSNFTTSQFDLIQSRLPFPLVTNQIEASVLHMDPLNDGTLDHLQKVSVCPMAWSPIGGGRLFSSQPDERTGRVVQTLKKIAKTFSEEVTVDQVAYAWLLAHPSKMIPIVGTNKIDRIRSLAECEKIQLDRQQWFTIWQASAGKEVP